MFLTMLTGDQPDRIPDPAAEHGGDKGRSQGRLPRGERLKRLIISLRQVTSLCCGCSVALAARARVCQPLGSVTVGESFKERNDGKFFPVA
jgi:hypothetical protein